MRDTKIVSIVVYCRDFILGGAARLHVLFSLTPVKALGDDASPPYRCAATRRDEEKLR